MNKEIKTSSLNISYEENGNPDSPVIILLHGFPDDAKTWDGINTSLVSLGYRTLAPYLRGYGSTRFLSETSMRSAQYSALVTDLVEFADALQIERFLLVGHDWGASISYLMAALHPKRLRGMVPLANGYNGAEQPELSLQQISAYWYQWYFNTERGKERMEKERKNVCRYLWELWSPGWRFTSSDFEDTAASWDNPDFVDIVVHSYRYRWKNAPGDPRYEYLEKRWKQKPEIEIPVILLQGAEDGASLPESSLDKERFFTNHYERRLIAGAGHFIQREKPEAVIQAIRDMMVLTRKN